MCNRRVLRPSDCALATSASASGRVSGPYNVRAEKPWTSALRISKGTPFNSNDEELRVMVRNPKRTVRRSETRPST